ncbi:hypothetical protein G7068_03495 [Leucobacter viscericola]|uniref:Prepilin type IV endopeptidase peptidase domain-containing protein n=1 Tax=Leucobacter viscericola TaxID=2714935 RepID=A0A6G7XD96_9MICO|nr:prepilin peptidase [Leucobacter viscericola]QIK62377.1 hypothetical protein G7068_03495 [Leucobacter viscericola]
MIPSATLNPPVSALALLWFFVLSVVVVVTDVRWRRIPNKVMLPALLGLCVLFTFPCAVALFVPSGFSAGLQFHALLSGLVSAAALFCVYLLLGCWCGVGGGDVKLASAVGLTLGFFGGWTAALLATALAWTAAGVWALGLAVARRVQSIRGRYGSRSPPSIPFAPFLVGGAWVTLLFAV